MRLSATAGPIMYMPEQAVTEALWAKGGESQLKASQVVRHNPLVLSNLTTPRTDDMLVIGST